MSRKSVEIETLGFFNHSVPYNTDTALTVLDCYFSLAKQYGVNIILQIHCMHQCQNSIVFFHMEEKKSLRITFIIDSPR